MIYIINNLFFIYNLGNFLILSLFPNNIIFYILQLDLSFKNKKILKISYIIKLISKKLCYIEKKEEKSYIDVNIQFENKTYIKKC